MVRYFIAKIGMLALGMVLVFGLLGPISSQAQIKSIKVSFPSATDVDDLPVILGLQILKRNTGVDFKVVPFNTSEQAVVAVVDRAVQIGVTSTPFFTAVEAGAPIKAFLQATGPGWNLVAKSTIATVQDLKGMTFGSHSPTSFTQALIEKFVIRDKGVKPKIVFIAGSEVRAQAMLHGRLDATMLDLANTKVVLDAAPGKFNVLVAFSAQPMIQNVFFARADFIEKNPKLIQQFIKAELQAFRRSTADPSLWVEEGAKYVPEFKPEDILATAKLSAQFNIYPANGGIIEKARGTLEFHRDAGNVKGLDVDRFFVFKPLKKVLSEIGRIEIKTE